MLSQLPLQDVEWSRFSIQEDARMWREFFIIMAGFITAFSAPIAIGIILIQQAARWSADRIIKGRKKPNVREMNQLIDVMMWFRRQVTEEDRERVRKLRRLKREVAT